MRHDRSPALDSPLILSPGYRVHRRHPLVTLCLCSSIPRGGDAAHVASPPVLSLAIRPGAILPWQGAALLHAAQDTARQGARGSVLIRHHLAIDHDVVHPFRALDPPRCPCWPIVPDLIIRDTDTGEVEDHEVCRQPFPDEATIVQAHDAGGLEG